MHTFGNQKLISRLSLNECTSIFLNDRLSWEKNIFSYLLLLCVIFLLPVHFAQASFSFPGPFIKENATHIAFSGSFLLKGGSVGERNTLTLQFEGESSADFSLWSSSVEVFSGDQEIASFDLRSVQDLGMYINIHKLNSISESLSLDGRSAAILSLVSTAFPELQGKWLSLADNDAGIFDKREVSQIQKYILPEFYHASPISNNLYIPTLDNQLMIRSWILARSSLVANSDEHTKSKLQRLDEYLDSGFTVDGAVDEKNGRDIRIIDKYENAFAFKTNIVNGEYSTKVPKGALPIGEALDQALVRASMI